MKLLFLFASIVFFSACNNSGESNMDEPIKKDSTGKDPLVENKSIAGCYMRVLERDTFVAVLQQKNDRVMGKLSFDNYQKDGSTGTVEGRIDGDVIKLIYSFQSEGMNSVMDVYFKKEGDGLIRGVGEMGVREDTAYYIDTTQINYPSNDILRKMDCQDLSVKYQ